MKVIRLSNGKEVLVSDRDYMPLSKFVWRELRPIRGRTSSYAVRSIMKNGRYANVLMHRQIKNSTGQVQVDHRNRNGLDNQRRNLRVATHIQNCLNRPKQRNNTSGFKGVFHAHPSARGNRRWFVRLIMNGKLYTAGRWFMTPLEAAAAYDKIARKVHGKFAYQNLIPS